ncbi:MAG: fibrobacter succinogenes major paralogous domain-containing protein [Brumimicrobium sp.]
MRKTLLKLSTAIMTIVMMTGCGNSSTDQNGNTFKTVKIGDQLWMAENLNVDKFRNGDPIPEASSDEDWQKACEEGNSAWCYYDNDPDNGKRYGKLYNWHAVNDPRGLAPKGWHIPTDEEWLELTDHLGGENIAGHKMKNDKDWREKMDGSNSSGFTALPGGYRHENNSFNDMFNSASWWSSTNEHGYIWFRGVHYYGRDVGRGNTTDSEGMSVRCVKDVSKKD